MYRRILEQLSAAEAIGRKMPIGTEVNGNVYWYSFLELENGKLDCEFMRNDVLLEKVTCTLDSIDLLLTMAILADQQKATQKWT